MSEHTEQLTKKLNYALRPDAQAFDEIRLVTVPRFKSSELSGSEWRISVIIQFFRKGKMIYEEWGGHEIEAASGHLYSKLHDATDNGHGYFAGDGIHCDQEGCSEKATNIFLVKKDFCVGGGNCGQEKKQYSTKYRCFCDKHKTRGDSDLEDNDDNYELVKTISNGSN